MSFDALVEALRHPPAPSRGLRAPRGGRRAAVLELFTREADPRLTFIERSASLRAHPGQMAFPGGGVEEGETAVEAALRESWEEVGLQSDLATVLGELPVAAVPVTRYDVTPVVAVWNGGELRVVDQAEVASVHAFRVSELASPEHRVSGRHPGGYQGPAFVFGELFIWGFTGHLVDQTLRLAGWEQPWDTRRVVDVPERFRR